MKLRSPSTFAALLVLLLASPAIFQGLDNLKRDVQHHMQAALWGVMLKFNGHGATDQAIPSDSRMRDNADAPTICSDTPAAKKQRKAEPVARQIAARRKSSPAPNGSGDHPGEEFSELASEVVAVADAEAAVQPRVAVWPVPPAAPEAFPALEVADAVASVAAPRRVSLPPVVTEVSSLRDLETKVISFAPAAHRQARIVLKHAADLERVSRRNWQPQLLIESQLRLLDPVKAKPCREAERKESETKAERQEPRRFVFTDNPQSVDLTASEE